MEGMDDRRRRLEAERDEEVARLAGLSDDYAGVVAASLNANADDEHDPEGATIAFERSQIGAFVVQVQEHLAEIRAALARLDEGTYGVCEQCGEPIGDERLQARPEARTCIRCARLVRR